MFLESCLGALFDAAYPAYVPTLIGRDRLVEGNSKLATSSSIAEIGGPGLAGTLVQLFSAPFAIFVDAVSFLLSALSLLLIRAPEPAPPPRDTSTRIVHEIVEGLGTVRRHAIVFPLAARSVPAHVFGAFYGVLYSIYLLRELHLDPFLLGIVISAGGVGSLVGSLFASRVVNRVGIGRALVGTAIAASMLGVLTPLAQGPGARARTTCPPTPSMAVEQAPSHDSALSPRAGCFSFRDLQLTAARGDVLALADPECRGDALLLEHLREGLHPFDGRSLEAACARVVRNEVHVRVLGRPVARDRRGEGSRRFHGIVH